MRYWLSIGDGKTYGPYTIAQLQELRAKSRLNAASQLCAEGDTAWVPAMGVLDANAGFPPAAPPTMPVAVPAGMDGGYAGFWKRAAATIIDGLLLLVPFVMIGVVLGLAGGGNALARPGGQACVNLLSVVMAWLYTALMESSATQATLGKMALGIKVTTLEGGRLSFGRASGRHFGKLVSGLTLGIGFIMAGFTARKQALHDIMAGCLVVNK